METPTWVDLRKCENILSIKERPMSNYGLRHSLDLMLTVQTIAETFPASDSAITAQMLFRTACVETLCGEYADKHPEKFGVGLTQIDKIAFKDIKKRTRKEVKETVKEVFNVDISKVKHENLARNPFLAVLFTRLHYMLVPEAFPKGIEAQAEYWKKHYNKSGKGTPQHFIERVAVSEEKLKEHPWLS
jgi:hypothetical protein